MGGTIASEAYSSKSEFPTCWKPGGTGDRHITTALLLAHLDAPNRDALQAAVKGIKMSQQSIVRLRSK